MTNKIWKTTDEAIGMRLDSYVAEKTALTRSAVQTLLTGGQITVNGVSAQKNYRLRAEDEIAVSVPDPVEYVAQPEDIPLDIV